MPVLLTDSPAGILECPAGFIGEYFPATAYGGIEQAALLAENLLLKLRKWGVESFIDLGPPGYLRDRLGEGWLETMMAELRRRRPQTRQRPAAADPDLSGATATTTATAGGGSAERQLARVETLKGRLQIGFESEAIAELRQIIAGPYQPAARRAAAWINALWLLDQGDRGSAIAAVESLASIGPPDRGDARDQHRYTVALCESLLESGRREEAKSLCLRAWDSHPAPDIALSMANALAAETDPASDVENDPGARPNFDADENRLGWINRSFPQGAAFRIRKAEADAALNIDNLAGDAVPLAGEQPCVSIIMPAYNAEQFLMTSVRSVLAQTWRNLELIIVDDASTDRTLEIAYDASRLDGRIKVLTCPKNRGTGPARNIGLAHATGDFVTVQDADDWSHPKKIETQIVDLLSHPRHAANLCEHVRVSTDLKFLRRGRPGELVAIYFSSLLFRRTEVLNNLGYWDSVRGGVEDDEFLRRCERWYGKENVKRLPTGPLHFARVHEQSLTQSPITGYPGFSFGARLEYWECSENWHVERMNEQESLRVDFVLPERPFPIPLLMRPEIDAAPHKFDVVIATDFRIPGGTNLSTLQEIKVQSHAGLTTGLMHVPRYAYPPKNRILPNYRELVDGNRVQILTFGDTVDADLVVFRWPPALAHRPKFVPRVRSDNVRIILNQTPMRRHGEEESFYDVMEVDRRVEEIFGTRGVWSPIGAEPRSVLDPYRDRLLISDENWVNIIDLDEWRPRCKRQKNARPVIGRHSRDHSDKWPETAHDLLAAYPDRSEFDVSILGGAEVPRSILGRLPDNWTVFQFNSITPYEFLARLDVFVYFTHSSYIEAFGRVIFEAMAVGVPVILPTRFRSTFGNAALYCEPDDVQKTVKSLLANERRYLDRVSTGRLFVEEKYGHGAHLKRMEPMVRALQN
ncbi:MAG: glycosyltransferase [Rhodospirillaceae bacterium]|nr:glycosyltransferase [Rhodospirillaceae bacterium]